MIYFNDIEKGLWKKTTLLTWFYFSKETPFWEGSHKTWGRCYDHNFLLISTILGDKIGVFLKHNLLETLETYTYICSSPPPPPDGTMAIAAASRTEDSKFEPPPGSKFFSRYLHIAILFLSPSVHCCSVYLRKINALKYLYNAKNTLSRLLYNVYT
jgi:hypothetical protein